MDFHLYWMSNDVSLTDVSQSKRAEETHRNEKFGRCINKLQYAQLISLVFINLNK